MEKIIISGGNPLRGTVQISGSKNAALPIIAATLLTSEPCTIRGVPNLSDIEFMCDILRWLSVKVTRDKIEGVVEVRAGHPLGVAPYELVRKMRASVCLLGPLLARLHNCKVSLPGGCVIGDRPIDQHIKGLKRLGADVMVENGYVHARCNELVGNDVFMGGRFGSTVTGTANILMAAVIAKGTTVIESAACEPEIEDLAIFLTKMGGRFGSTVLGTANVLMAAVLATGTTWIEGAACEPEVEDLANFLVKMGAKIKGIGGHILEIEGVRELHGAEHTVSPDRIEAGTFMAAAAITGGDIEIKGARAEHLSAVRDKLEETGVTSM